MVHGGNAALMERPMMAWHAERLIEPTAQRIISFTEKAETLETARGFSAPIK